jgi:hypothetical protein
MLTYAIWSSLLIVWFLSYYKSKNQENFEPFFVLHLFLLIASAYPIIKWKNRILVKIITLFIHYLLVLFCSFYILYLGLVLIHGWKN